MGYYLQTKFRGNPKGSSVFCVDLAWNDPHTTVTMHVLVKIDHRYSTVGPLPIASSAQSLHIMRPYAHEEKKHCKNLNVFTILFHLHNSFSSQ